MGVQAADRFGHYVGRGDGWWLLTTLLVVAAVAGAAALVAQTMMGRSGRPVDGPGGPSPTRPDEAVAQLRLRYARGEVSREEFLQTAADLGSPVASGEEIRT